ncbi:MAG TPA: hypothetical protein VFU59_04530 [Candidatus Eisenbacteria bacterium]|nr:hypothetical protein [Candidatus Eisenbacteria bacterium]
MKLTVGDAFSAVFDAVREFRWTEFSPFFLILMAQWIFLGLTTQLHHSWAMGVVAPIAQLAGGTQNLHYPAFYGYLSILLGWVESFLYSVAGAVLIPLSLLRYYARSDRALSLGAGSATRLVSAVLPTLLAGLAGIGCIWGWQRFASPQLMTAWRQWAPEPMGGFLGWLAVTLGGYAIQTLVVYIPVAAVQARTNPIRAIGYGLRFGIRSWPLTLLFAVFFGAPAIFVQFLLERQGGFILARLRPEVIVAFLAVYAAATSVATHLTYNTAARLYTLARGEK